MQYWAKRGLSRRVALTVPNFMFGLAALADTDFISAMPARFVAMHGPRFGVVAVKSPIESPRFRLNLVAPQVALMDAGLAWLVQLLGQVQTGNGGSSILRSGRRNRSMHSQ